MRIVSYLIAVIFILFALVQYNDPDFFIWIPVYLIPAFIAIAYQRLKIHKAILGALTVLFVMAAVVLFPPSINHWIEAEETAGSLGMTLPGIEQARESIGLVLCALATGFYWLKS